MKDILAKLQKPLTRADIDFRVGSVGKGSTPFATILAYKDARTDMRILDEATDGMWQNEYRRDSKGILQCGIGIKFVNRIESPNGGTVEVPGTGEWVWKWSNGMPSNQESEKGEYSDAFKRAGFMWGIGRDLYDVPQLFVTLHEGEYYMDNGKVKATSKLKPNSWDWEISEDMKSFTASDKYGRRVSVDEREVSEAPQTAPNAPQSFVAPKAVQSTRNCAVCNTEFIVNPQFPKGINCSASCGNRYKAGERYAPPAELPVIDIGHMPPNDNEDIIPF